MIERAFSDGQGRRGRGDSRAQIGHEGSSQSALGRIAIDPRFEALKSTAFFGKWPACRTIAQIQETVELLPKNSRRELARTICEHLDRRMRGGGYREQLAPRVQKKLEVLGPGASGEAKARRSPEAGRACRAVGPGAGSRLRPE
ncbi:MAG: hypothetical protein OXI01_23745 [Albidovulum sp.]|nr:hypothetical protein [Albidovulum sp.]